jgi:3D-(3,5/4)-trihydroxycyclohexane-1,2-dione acylhydrolase (decyclizing)
MNFGAAGVDGSAAANAVAARADLVIGVGTRLQDFTTGSRTLFSAPGRKLVSINIQAYDAAKHGGGGAGLGCEGGAGEAGRGLGDYHALCRPGAARGRWLATTDAIAPHPRATSCPPMRR